MKFAALSIVLVVGIVALISTSSITGMAAKTIKGDIFDANGQPLYRNWRQSLSMIVAVDQNGEVVGWGPLETSRSYKLSLRGKATLPLSIKLGYFDPKRPDRGTLVDCTTITDVSKFTDIVCDKFDTMLPAKVVAYR